MTGTGGTTATSEAAAASVDESIDATASAPISTADAVTTDPAATDTAAAEVPTTTGP